MSWARLEATLELAEKLRFGAVERRSRYGGLDGKVLDGQAAVGVDGLSGKQAVHRIAHGFLMLPHGRFL